MSEEEKTKKGYNDFKVSPIIKINLNILITYMVKGI